MSSGCDLPVCHVLLESSVSLPPRTAHSSALGGVLCRPGLSRKLELFKKPFHGGDLSQIAKGRYKREDVGEEPKQRGHKRKYN